jgi:hypothetical protein
MDAIGINSKLQHTTRLLEGRNTFHKLLALSGKVHSKITTPEDSNPGWYIRVDTSSSPFWLTEASFRI